MIDFPFETCAFSKSQNLAHHYTEAHFWHDICHQHIDPRTNICQHSLDNAVPQKIVSTIVMYWIFSAEIVDQQKGSGGITTGPVSLLI